MTSAEAPAPGGALCSKHPSVAAKGVCSRCGSFACGECVGEQVPPVCKDCVERWADPLGVRSVPFSFGAAFAGGWKLFLAALGPALLVSFPFAVLDYAAAIALDNGSPNSWRWTIAISGLIYIAAEAARIYLLGQVIRGESASLPQSWGYALKNFGSLWTLNFRATLTALGYALLLLVPGIIKLVEYSLIFEAKIIGGHSDGMERSKHLAQGHRWSLFGLLMLFFIAQMLVVAVFIVPVVFLPEEGAENVERVLDAVSSVVQLPLEVLSSCVFVAAYLGLERSSRNAD